MLGNGFPADRNIRGTGDRNRNHDTQMSGHLGKSEARQEFKSRLDPKKMKKTHPFST